MQSIQSAPFAVYSCRLPEREYVALKDLGDSTALAELPLSGFGGAIRATVHQLALLRRQLCSDFPLELDEALALAEVMRGTLTPYGSLPGGVLAHELEDAALGGDAATLPVSGTQLSALVDALAVVPAATDWAIRESLRLYWESCGDRPAGEGMLHALASSGLTIAAPFVPDFSYCRDDSVFRGSAGPSPAAYPLRSHPFTLSELSDAIDRLDGHQHAPVGVAIVSPGTSEHPPQTQLTRTQPDVRNSPHFIPLTNPDHVPPGTETAVAVIARELTRLIWRYDPDKRQWQRSSSNGGY
jgi:hypothetical protein